MKELRGIILLCCLWIKLKHAKVFCGEPGNPWEQNWHFTLMQKTVQMANKSYCWICTHFPKHSNRGIPSIGISLNFSFPEFVKHVQNNSDQTPYNETIGEEWTVHNVPGNYYQCLERCNHNTDWLPRPKVNCTGAMYVGKYANCSKGTFEIRY